MGKYQWIKIKEMDVGGNSYALLLARRPVTLYSNGSAVPFKASGSASNYGSSDLRNAVNSWYSSNASSMPELVKVASKVTSLGDEKSRPTGSIPGRADSDVMFIPSKSETQLASTSKLISGEAEAWTRTMINSGKAYSRKGDLYLPSVVTKSLASARPAVWVWQRKSSKA
jgi:hypothetical protein